MTSTASRREDLSQLSPAEARQRKREWNRGPVGDLFPRMPAASLEQVLNLCIDKDVVYNLSQSKAWNARRLSSVVIAHVRHFYSDYDALLRRERLERYEARARSAPRVWKVLREWCPWDESNEALEPCFRATLLPPALRDPTWDPMDIDIEVESDDGDADQGGDPMDLD